MGKAGIQASVVGLAVNFGLFLIKLYISISANSLSIYCDAVNNLADTLSCIVALVGFILMKKLDARRSERVQALSALLIGIAVAVTGFYFAYNGVEKIMYPTVVSFSKKYALLVLITVFVKLFLGVFYVSVNKRRHSAVIKTLITDSFLDSGITLTVLLGFSLTAKIHYAIDGLFAIVIGIAVTVSAVKTIFMQAKYLIND